MDHPKTRPYGPDDHPTSVRPVTPGVPLPAPRAPSPPLPAEPAVVSMARRLYLSDRATRLAEPDGALAPTNLPERYDQLTPRFQRRYLGMARTALRDIAHVLGGLADEG